MSNSSGQINVTESNNVTLGCRAEGNPAPSLNWFMADKKLPGIPVTTVLSGDARTVMASTLSIDQVTKNNSTEYKCQATNAAGRKDQIFRLNVQCE